MRVSWSVVVERASPIALILWLCLTVASALAETSLQLVDDAVTQFNPSAEERARLVVVAPPDSKRIEATVHTRDGEKVRVLVAEDKTDGHAELVWDGRDERGNIVPDEAYGLLITAYDASGTSIAELDLRESDEAPLSFASGRMNADLRIEATLEQAARVQVRIGIEGGPLLRTLDDWRPRVAGRFTVPWDGFDQSGAAYVADDTNLKTLVSTRELPKGAFLTFGNDAKRQGETPLPSLLSVSTTCESKGTERMVDVTVSRAASEIPVDGGYEVAFYVDHAFVSEEERGYLPIRWRWNASGTARDRHLLTVNLLKFDGDILLGSAHVDTATTCSTGDQE